jgi:hypothetical protein
MCRRCRRYGCLNLLFDILMTLITAAMFGFPVWWIWIFFREMRRPSCRCY